MFDVLMFDDCTKNTKGKHTLETTLYLFEPTMHQAAYSVNKEGILLGGVQKKYTRSATSLKNDLLKVQPFIRANLIMPLMTLRCGFKHLR